MKKNDTVFRYFRTFILACALVCGMGIGTVQAADEKPAKAPTVEYVEMTPMVVPVITERGLTQQITLVVSLEIPAGKRDDVTHLRPRLVDAYLSDLYGAMGTGQVLVNGQVLDIEQLKARLKAVTTRIMGPDLVREVLLQAIQQRPMGT